MDEMAKMTFEETLEYAEAELEAAMQAEGLIGKSTPHIMESTEQDVNF